MCNPSTSFWKDLTDAVCTAVSMEDVVERYSPESDHAHHTTICPNCGSALGCYYTHAGFQCIYCAADGNQVDFLRLTRHLKSNFDAIRLILQDFGLGIKVEPRPSRSVQRQDQRQHLLKLKRTYTDQRNDLNFVRWCLSSGKPVPTEYMGLVSNWEEHLGDVERQLSSINEELQALQSEYSNI